MAKDTQKYGPSNMSMAQEGKEVVVRFETDVIVRPAGEPLPGNKKDKDGNPQLRAHNLIATSNGFAPFAGVKVSLNVNSV